jgi:hypothetical protein
MLSAFTSYWYALAWSGLVFLSYATYQTDAYQENYWLVAIEYTVILGLLLFELKGNNYHARISHRTG